MNRKKQKRIAIMVDSSSNLTKQKCLENDIYLIPLIINFNNGTSVEDTEENIKKTKFYEKVKNNEYTTTSLSSSGKLIEIWKKLLKENYEHIVFIPIAKGLSGQYQNANLLSQEDEFKNKVHVIDTNAAATVNSYMALKASEIAKNNGTIQDIMLMIKKVKKSNIIFIIPEDISRLSKGGRAKSVLTSLINWVRIKLIVKFEETSQFGGMARTLNNAMETCIIKIREFLKKEKDYVLEILNSECNEKIENTIKNIIQKNNDLNIKRNFLPNVFVSHAGVNSIGIIVIKKI